MSRNEMREEEEEEQSEYTRRYSSTTSPTVGHACFKYKHPPLPVDSQINPPFSLIRVHDVVRPLRKTSGGCMFGRRMFTEETGWLTRNRGLSQFLTNILSDRATVGHPQLSLLTTEVKK